ncbi:hypothetical protein TELCIR_00173 [Teladorsagia circumcincta]|uniref:Uncharacterized protein n=1 Tax=Teladorsagia circumcincta TaxID=45464 RepID=A0A2G9V5L7_TELCI|nr:hypothetical protein TELCIR_00173 [Teladorsagia circumcincta]
MARVRSEQRKQLAIAFHRALMRLGAKKIPAHCPISTDNFVSGKTPSRPVRDSPSLSCGTPPPKLKKEVSIHMCKECGKVNCEWHCADCCDNSGEDEENEDNEDNSNDGVGNRRLRQRRDSLRAKRLAAVEEEKRAYRAAIAAGVRSAGSSHKSPDTKKAAQQAKYVPEEEELGEDCFVILDDDEVEL